MAYVTAFMPYFNPRSHERSDGISVAPEAISEDFNPRSHERSDYAWQDKKGNIKSISIHAPTRGATKMLKIMFLKQRFQSTLPREERQQYCTKNLFIFIQYRQ